MAKENIESNQMISLIIMFVFGSSVVMGVSNKASQDSWISILIAIALAIPLLLMYARIVKLNPGQNLFDISDKLFGKVIGKIINILMTWYAVHLGGMVLCNFEEFVELSSLPSTPDIVIGGLMILVAIYIAKSSITTLGKWGAFILLVFIVNLIFTMVLALGIVDIKNILPVFDHSVSLILSGSFDVLTYPLGESVLFLALANYIKKNDSPKKIYIIALSISSFFLLLTFLRNLMVLGPEMLDSVYFPSFISVRVIEFGNFLTRIEGVVTINFVLAGISKIVICLFAGAKGLTNIFNIKNYKDMVVPTGLIMVALCTILYDSVLEMIELIDVYAIYVIPFQLIIPIMIWIASEIKNKKSVVSN